MKIQAEYPEAKTHGEHYIVEVAEEIPWLGISQVL